MKVVVWTFFSLCEVVCGRGGLSGSGLYIRGRKFVGLGLQGQPDRLSVRNIFEVPFTEERTGAGKLSLKEGSSFQTLR